VDSARLRLRNVDPFTINRAQVVLDGENTVFENDANADLLGDLRRIDHGSSLTIRNGANLDLSPGDFENFGELTLDPAGTLAVDGQYTQAVDARLTIGLGGDPGTGEFGQIMATGTASLDGTIAVALVNGFGPVTGQTWQPVTLAGRNGTFHTIEVPLLAQQPSLEVVHQVDSVVVNALVTAGDLSVTPGAIVVPNDVVAGQEATIQYTVDNLSDTVAEGEWTDSLYLSADSSVDPSDRLIARHKHTGDVPGLASYTETVTAPLPSDSEGLFRVLVVADSRGRVPDIDRSNNLGVSVNAARVSVTPLPIGQSLSPAVQNGQSRYYRVDVPPGDDVRITAQLANPLQADVLARFGNLPTRSDFDLSASDVSSLDRQIMLSGRSGAWYLLVHGRENAQAGQTLDLTAELVQFEVATFSPRFVGNVGPVSLTLTGSGFSSSLKVVLIAEDGTEYAANRTLFRSRNESIVTFDLNGVEPGQYQLRAEDGEHSAIAGQTLDVFNGGEPGRLVVDVVTNERIRVRGHGNVSIHLFNAGDSDVPIPPFTLQDTESGTSSFVVPVPVRGTGAPDGSEELERVLLAGTEGTTAGLLPPRESTQYSFSFSTSQDVPSDPKLRFTLQSGFAAPLDTPLDWNGLKEDARPPFIQADAWDAIYQNFTGQIGQTLGDLQSALTNTTAYLSQFGRETDDIDALLGFLFSQANNALPNRTLASATDASVPTPGPDLTFTRTYRQSLASRYRRGPFGRGWTHAYDFVLRQDPDQASLLNPDETDFLLFTPAGIRRFERAERPSLFSDAIEIFWKDQDGAGEIEQIGPAHILTNADGTKFTFDGTDGRLLSVRDPNGNSLDLEYDKSLLTAIQHSNGDRITLQYNANAMVEKLIDHAGRETSYIYDSSGEHLTEVTGPLGTLRYTYDTQTSLAREHALTSTTDRTGAAILYAYDDRGRLVGIERNNGVAPLTVDYDQGQVTITNADNDSIEIFYDAFGQVARFVDADGQLTNVDNRTPDLSRLTLPGNVSYDFRSNRGFVTNVTDAAGDSVSQAFHRVRRFGSAAGAFAGVPIDTYRLTSLVDQLGRKTEFQYDNNGNRTAVVYPDGVREQFAAYDAAGNPTEYRNRRDQAVNLTFNNRGQLLRKDHADGTFEQFTYNSLGNMLTAAGEHGTIAFEYDAADRLSAVHYPSGRSLQYQYNAKHQVIRLDDGAGNATEYEYDEAGRLKRLKDSDDALLVEYIYDEVGRLGREIHGNGTYTTYQYDDASRLEHLVHHAADDSVTSRFDYEYDALGRRTSMGTVDGEWTYTFDATGQLTRAVFASTNPDIPDQDLNYEYDAAGNRVRTLHNGVARDYGVNNRNQYTTVGTASYTYDDDGNLVMRADGPNASTYVYDDESRLIEVTTPQGTWTYQYDALGHRTAVIHNGQRTEYLVEPLGLGDVVGEYDDAGNVIAHYAHGHGLEARLGSGGAAFYQFDALGSTVALAGLNGSIINQYHYGPFGSLLVPASEAIANPFGFVGQFGVMTEGNGLHFMRQRYYSASDGRFISEDPIRHEGSINLYTYALNEPTGFIDRVGRDAEDPGSVRELVVDRFRSVEQRFGLDDFSGVDPHISENALNTAEWAFDEGASGAADLAEDRTEILVDAAESIARDPDDAIHLGEFAYQRGRSLLRDLGQNPGSFFGDLLCDLVDCDGGGTVGEGVTVVVASFDPNDITGHPGFGDEHFVTPDQLLPYTIRFENLASATAPAQEVVITQQLDPDLDWTTFELGDFGFGDLSIEVPAGRDFYSTRLDLRNTLDVLVDVTAGINQATGEARWTFTAMDPDTLDLPIDPLVGFLPPNQMSPEGEGFVSYSILPQADATTGTRIDADARIVFDLNDPIDTPAIFNTIDSAPPVSSVDPVPGGDVSPHFDVSWLGDDGSGSGVAEFDIYVSTDGGPFAIWLEDTTDTTATFFGRANTSYDFYSVATDHVGHQESIPAAPDASVTAGSASIADRRVFYNNTALDGNSPDAAAADDAAIAPSPAELAAAGNDPALGKTALRAGNTATFENYTGFAGGLTGVMLDVVGLADPDALTAADFQFASGNHADPASWSAANDPLSTSVRKNAGVGGADRITIIWAANNGDDVNDPHEAVAGQWLGVRLLATPNTGLAQDEWHAWGNAPGEVGNGSTSAEVNVLDALITFNALATNVGPESKFDHNRDGTVNVTDALLSFNGLTAGVLALQPIDLTNFTAAPDSTSQITASENNDNPSAAERDDRLWGNFAEAADDDEHDDQLLTMLAARVAIRRGTPHSRSWG